jgi:tetratricopeptide (TPR) repeat protein
VLAPLDVEIHIGRASRNITASNSLILTDFFSFRHLAELERRVGHAGLYQEIAQTLIRGLNTKQVVANLVSSLVSTADRAHSMRRLDVVGYVGRLLPSLALGRNWETVGDYYVALSINRAGHGDTVNAGRLFEKAAESAPLHYRARALLALGSNCIVAGEHKTAMSFYSEVMRVAGDASGVDPVTLYHAVRGTAVSRGTEGDHQGAVADLQRMFPLIRIARSRQPYTYYDYMNSLAVELTELGRLEEAAHASTIACRFPAIEAYPEWQETFAEVEVRRARASRSVVPVRQHIEEPGNLLHLPSPGQPASPGIRDNKPRGAQARVLNFQHWKTMVKASTAPHPKEATWEHLGRMTTGQKLIRLMDLISQDETDDETIDRILEAVEQIVSNRRNQKLD